MLRELCAISPQQTKSGKSTKYTYNSILSIRNIYAVDTIIHTCCLRDIDMLGPWERAAPNIDEIHHRKKPIHSKKKTYHGIIQWEIRAIADQALN